MRNQFALYRVNPLTSGKVLWHKTFEEVREMGIPVRIELYRPYHLELLEKEEPVSLSEAQSSARRLTRTALPSAAPSSDCLRQTKRNLLRIPLFLPPSPMKSACSDLKMYRLEIG